MRQSSVKTPRTRRAGASLGAPHPQGISAGWGRDRFASPAEPVEGFRSFAELLYDIAIVLAVMLGLALIANVALAA